MTVIEQRNPNSLQLGHFCNDTISLNPQIQKRIKSDSKHKPPTVKYKKASMPNDKKSCSSEFFQISTCVLFSINLKPCLLVFFVAE